MSEIKTDYRGYVQHWIRSENDFTYNCMEYERDEENGRCYMLVESCNLRPEMDGALVKKELKNPYTKKHLKNVRKYLNSRNNSGAAMQPKAGSNPGKMQRTAK